MIPHGGHVSNVTTCASFLTKRFEMGVFEVLPRAIVGSVGMSRVLYRRHWLSDQTIGLVFGYAVGKEVAIRSLRRRSGGSSSSDASGAFLESSNYRTTNSHDALLTTCCSNAL